jgi:hypothetical protein
MENSSPFRITIPKPCHENWEEMTPEEKGRHCAVCDKVVRDFTQNTPEEVAAELLQSTGLCGRFRTEHLYQAGGAMQIAYRFPVERIRHFVLAFVMTFGLSAWGLAENEIKTMEPAIAAFQKMPIEEVLAIPVPDSSRIYGLVLDEKSHEPLAEAVITAEMNGKVITRCVTDSSGVFHLQVTRQDRRGMALRVQWMDKMTLRERVPTDIHEITVLIDGGIEANEVVIEGRAVTAEVRFNGVPVIIKEWQGIPESGINIFRHDPGCRCFEFDDDNHYYHKLHDYIQMRSSEVFTKDY